MSCERCGILNIQVIIANGVRLCTECLLKSERSLSSIKKCQKVWYKKTTFPVTCDCGVTVSNKSLQVHLATPKHEKLMQEKLQTDEEVFQDARTRPVVESRNNTWREKKILVECECGAKVQKINLKVHKISNKHLKFQETSAERVEPPPTTFVNEDQMDVVNIWEEDEDGWHFRSEFGCVGCESGVDSISAHCRGCNASQGFME